MRRRTVAGLVAAAAALALVVGAGIVWPGLDAQETPEVDTSVWALQTGEGRRYARVNTSIGELDTVRSISNPSEVVETSDAAFLFSDSYSRLTKIDEALPVDLDDEALRASPSTPAGTTEVATAGDFVAYRTDSGAVWVGRLSAGEAAQLDPASGGAAERAAVHRGRDRRRRARQAVQLLPRRRDRAAVRHRVLGGARARSARRRGAPDARPSPRPAISGRSSTPTTATSGCAGSGGPGSRPTRPARSSSASPIRTAPRCTSRPRRGSSGAGRRLGADARGRDRDRARHSGAAHRPRRRGLRGLARRQGDGGGVLWSSGSGETIALDYGAPALGDQRRPVFVASDDAVILNETRSGWVWTVPDGRFVASSQDWSLDDRTDADVAAERRAALHRDRSPAADRRAGCLRRACGRPHHPARPDERPRPERGRAVASTPPR